MSTCKIREKEVINEIDNVDTIVKAVIQKEENKLKAEADARYKRTGSYGVPSKRISQYIGKTKELVGKVITIELIDSDTYTNVKAKTVQIIGKNTVEINGKYRVVLGKNKTVDGANFVTVDDGKMGSEGTFNKKGTEKLETVSGPILAELEGLVGKTLELDGDELSDIQRDNLMRVFRMYRDTLLEAGKDVDVTVDMLQELEDKGTRGEAVPRDGKIELINGNKRFNTSTDILAHELQHIMLRELLKTNAPLRSKILKLRDAIAAEVDYTIFLPKSDVHSENDIAYAKERYEYVFNNPSKVIGVAAEEFLAGATTNEQLAETMKLINNPKEYTLISKSERVGKDGKPDMLTKLWNGIVEIINVIYRSKVMGKGSHELAMNLLDEALQTKYKLGMEEQKAWYQKAIEKIANADKKIADFTEKGKKETIKYDEYLRSNEESRFDKMTKALWRIKGLSHARNYALENKLLGSVLLDMSDPNIAKFYQIFRHTKAFVENMVAPVTTSTIAVLDKEYELGKIKKTERRAAKRILIDTDAKVLGKSADVLEYLKDANKITAGLNDGYTELKEEFGEEITGDILIAIDSTANLLVHNKAKMVNGYVNAAQIGLEYTDKSKGKYVDLIDKMITLKALQEVGDGDKELAARAIENDSKGGLDYAMDLVAEQEKALLKEAYYNDPMYLVKGASNEKYAEDKSYYLVDEKEMNKLTKAGLVSTGLHAGLSKAIGKNMYIVVGDSLEVAYTEGLISKVQLRNEGDSLRRILSEHTDMDEKEVVEAIEKLESEEDYKHGTLIPERTGKNVVYDYRVRIPYEVKVKYLGMEDDIIKVTGDTVSNLSHKQEAILNNRSGLMFFDRMYKENRGNKDYKFIEISEDSEGKFKEYWESLPFYLKGEIMKKYNGKLMVEQSLLVDTFGYKDASAINMPWIKNSKKRQLVTRKIEKVVMEIAKGWKDSIVAKTWDTIKGNSLSNAMVVTSHMKDKNPARYTSQIFNFWGEMNTYKELKSKKLRLELDRKAGRKVNEKAIAKIESDMKNNSVHTIMEDGQYTSILEDIDTNWLSKEGPVEEVMNEMLKKAKLGKNLNMKEAVDLLYAKKGSRFHDSLMKMTLYMDALNKIVLLEEFKMQARELKDNGKSYAENGNELLGASESEMEKLFNSGITPQTWLNYVDGLFVNYGYLDNRFIKYGNDTLVLSFTKYFFRVFGPMMKMARSKAVSTFFMEIVNNGLKLGDTPLTQFYNPLNSLYNKTGNVLKPIDNLEEIATPVAFKWLL